MGEIYKSTCKVCGTSWKYKVGCGIAHCNLDTVLGLFDEEIKDKVKMWANGKAFPRFQFNYHKGICMECKAIVGVPMIKLIPENTLYIGTCEECGGDVEVNEEKDNKKCPICEKNGLEEFMDGLWD